MEPQNNNSGSTLSTNAYITTDSTTGYIQFATDAGYSNSILSYSVKAKSGIAPELYFRFVKKKFGTIEQMRLNSRLKKLEAAFYKAVDNGQTMLGEKLMRDLTREARESAILAKGFKHFIEHDDLNKHKRNIRNGHISDTLFKDYTRVIPEDVLAKKKKSEGLFDGYVIYHYYDREAEEKREKKQKMSAEEKSRMRDPILFGVIKESTRLYFIADWEDELCDLTFDEIVDVIGKSDDEVTISRNPKLSNG
jgi:hypothetical protein